MVNRIRDAFELLRRTPAGKEALQAHELEIATDRELHVAAIEEAQAKLHDALPKLNADVAEAQKQWDRARKAADAAEATHRSARSALNNAVHRAGHARDTHQDKLAKGSDPRIPGVCAKLRLVYLKESTGGLVVQYEETGSFDAMSRYPNPLMRISDNRKARLRRMTAMRDALTAIDALRFNAKADVGEEIRLVLEGLPDGTVLEFAYKGYAKELRGQNVVDLYRPVDVSQDFAEVLQPVEFVSRDDGGTGGGGAGYGADFPEGIPSGIPMAR